MRKSSGSVKQSNGSIGGGGGGSKGKGTGSGRGNHSSSRDSAGGSNTPSSGSRDACVNLEWTSLYGIAGFAVAIHFKTLTKSLLVKLNRI